MYATASSAANLGAALRAPPALRRPARTASSLRRVHRSAVVPTAAIEAKTEAGFDLGQFVGSRIRKEDGLKVRLCRRAPGSRAAGRGRRAAGCGPRVLPSMAPHSTI